MSLNPGFGLVEMLGLFLVVLVGFVLPIVLVVLMVRWWVNRDRSGTEDPGALLRDRLARGEITQEEFDAGLVALGYPPRGEGPPPG
jgi:uncharacterized membrane protein